MNITNLILADQVQEPTFYQYMLLFVGMIVTVGVIFYIINNIVKTINYAKRGLTNLITTVILIAIFVVSYFIDANTNKVFLGMPVIYFVFVGITALIGVTLTVTFFSRAKSKFHRVLNKVPVYTVKEKDTYLYFVFKYKDYVYINKTTSSGLVVKMKKNQFVDDIIGEVIKENRLVLEDENCKPMGQVTIKGKKNTVYDCFLLEVLEEPFLEDYYRVDKFDLIKWEINVFDKSIIMRLILGDEFKLELDEKK